ncbi:MAG TPA: hypothetical protein VF411_15710 [Bacteroidia bacterium]
MSVEDCNCNKNPYTQSTITPSSNLTGVEHSFNNDVTIATSTTITNKTFYFAPNIKMIVSGGSTLTLNHCHLLACTDMWQGIIVQLFSAIGTISFTLDVFYYVMGFPFVVPIFIIVCFHFLWFNKLNLRKYPICLTLIQYTLV